MYYVFFCSASCKMLRKFHHYSCEQWGWRGTGQAGCGCHEQPSSPEHSTAPGHEQELGQLHTFHTAQTPNTASAHPVNNTGGKAAKIQVRLSITHIIFHHSQNHDGVIFHHSHVVATD